MCGGDVIDLYHYSDVQWVSKEWVQFNFCEEARGKITSGILKYPNMLIWFLNMYIRYSNMYIMPNDCFQQFRVSIFITFIGNIN